MFKGASNKILSYQELVLYNDDIESLCKPNGWLTDNLVNFGAAFLKNNIVKKNFQDRICIVYATLSEMIKFSENNDELYKEIGLSAEKWCLFIFSDNRQPEIVHGGSHWCLIMYNPLKRQFVVFDSMPRSKICGDIYEFARKLRKFLNVDLGKEFIVASKSCPTMPNSGDCGIFVIEYIGVILTCLSEYFECNNNISPVFNLMSAINHEYIQTCRQKWLSIINDLSNKQ